MLTAKQVSIEQMLSLAETNPILGSGKTYTMLDPNRGLYILACRDIVEFLQLDEYREKLSAFVSFYEIYQGQLYDLLNDRKKLHAREDGNQNVVIQGIEEFEVHSVQDLMYIFDRGSMERSTGIHNPDMLERFVLTVLIFIFLQDKPGQMMNRLVLMLSFKLFCVNAEANENKLASFHSSIWQAANVARIAEMRIVKRGEMPF